MLQDLEFQLQGPRCRLALQLPLDDLPRTLGTLRADIEPSTSHRLKSEHTGETSLGRKYLHVRMCVCAGVSMKKHRVVGGMTYTHVQS